MHIILSKPFLRKVDRRIFIYISNETQRNIRRSFDCKNGISNFDINCRMDTPTPNFINVFTLPVIAVVSVQTPFHIHFTIGCQLSDSWKEKFDFVISRFGEIYNRHLWVAETAPGLGDVAM